MQLASGPASHNSEIDLKPFLGYIVGFDVENYKGLAYIYLRTRPSKRASYGVQGNHKGSCHTSMSINLCKNDTANICLETFQVKVFEFFLYEQSKRDIKAIIVPYKKIPMSG